MGINWRPDRPEPRCVHCGKLLTAEEAYFYESGCEKCERRILEEYKENRTDMK